jgi:hypothetical protein
VPRVLLRGAPDIDLWGEFTTVAEGFVAVGSEAELRAQTEFSDEQWERARATGSSAARGDYAYADQDGGLIVQDAGDNRQRWLPRPYVADYLLALLRDDRHRRLQLTRSFDEEATPASGAPLILVAEDAAEPAASPPAPAGRPFNVRGAVPHAGDPEELLLLVDHIPSREEMRWRERDGLYVAEQDGCVSQLHAGGDGRGFYGASFELTMDDGTRRTLVGPYSGAPGSVNEAFPELGGVVVAAATETPFGFSDGGGGTAIMLTTARLAEIHAQFPELAERQRSAIADRDQLRRRRERLLSVEGGGEAPPAAAPLPGRPGPGLRP